jgi:hypothetical protein
MGQKTYAKARRRKGREEILIELFGNFRFRTTTIKKQQNTQYFQIRSIFKILRILRDLQLAPMGRIQTGCHGTKSCIAIFGSDKSNDYRAKLRRLGGTRWVFHAGQKLSQKSVRK